MDSHVRSPEPRRNAKTECIPVPRRAPDLRAAYAFARGVVRSSPDALRGMAGHRLVWVRNGAFGGLPLLAHPDAFAIAGRHTQCGLVLPDDPFVALRSALVRSIALPNGKVALRILDLHTDTGFTLADDSQQTSVLAEGPVAVGLGEYALVALPGETPDDALPNDLPAPEVEAVALAGPYRTSAKPNNRTSRITLMPRLVMLGESLSPSLGRMTTGARWAVTLERGGRQAMVSVTADDLRGGVVIGRSEKCHSEGLRRITDNNTSRVHVLILREGERVQAFDLASTQGMYRNDVAARRVDLADTGTTLRLSRGETAVRFDWRRI